MRKLMWFAIGFTAACGIGIYLLSGVWLVLLGLFSLVAAIALLFSKTKLSRMTAVVLLGVAVGLGWLGGYDAHYLNPARQADGTEQALTVTVSDYSFQSAYGVGAAGELTLSGRTYKVQVYLDYDTSLSPGDQISGIFKLRFTGFSGKQEATYHQGKGIFLLAYGDEDAVIEKAAQVPEKYFASGLRQNILNWLDQAFPADTAGFARALLLGDSSLLTYEEDTAFQVSGIRHVIAVSGLHVSILFALVYTLCGKRRILTALLGIPLLFVFAAVAGFTPSVMRACLMQVLMILALLFNREYDPPTALAFAVLTMLTVNPVTITSASFQLSVGCMMGIFLFSGKIHHFLLEKTPLGPAKGKSLRAKICRFVSGSVSITLSAMVITTPLCAIYFGMVSIIGILTNLLTLWVISFVFYGIMAASVAAAVWLPLGQGIAWIISWPIRYVMGTAQLLAKFPLAAVYTDSAYIVLWLLFVYVQLTVFFFSKKKHPWLFLGCTCVGLVAAVAISWAEPRLDDYRFTALDVGQGQCLLIQSKGETYLVDCGNHQGEAAADIAASHLLSQGITFLDGLFLTHYDVDHAGGVAALLSRVPAKQVYLPAAAKNTAGKEALLQSCNDFAVEIMENTQVTIAGGSITLYPSSEDAEETSMCILFQLEKCDILITGDRDLAGERDLLETADLPDIEVLVAGHHGSKYATGLELLHATMPEIVVISVGADNSYGHPAPETQQRLALFGCQVYRTDKHGTITFRG